MSSAPHRLYLPVQPAGPCGGPVPSPAQHTAAARCGDSLHGRGAGRNAAAGQLDGVAAVGAGDAVRQAARGRRRRQVLRRRDGDLDPLWTDTCQLVLMPAPAAIAQSRQCS